MGGIPSAIIAVGSFNSTDGSVEPSEGSSGGNVGMPLVLRSGSIGIMGIPDVSVGGPGSKISGYRCDYYRSFLSYVAVLNTIEHLAIVVSRDLAEYVL